MTPNERFELWIKSPEMQKAQAALKAIDEFWAAKREEGLRKHLEEVAQFERRKYAALKKRWEGQ